MRAISLKMNEMVLQKKVDSNGLHCAMQLPMRIAQVFGFFPIYVGGSSYRSLKIKWLYWRIFYSFITIITFALVTAGTIWRQIPEKKNILTIDNMIFAANAFIYSVLLLKLTIQWPDFVKEWYIIEARMVTNEMKGNLKKQLNTIAVAVMVLATVEHYLINAYVLKTSMEPASTISEGMKNYFNTSFGAVLSYFEYSFWIGLIFEMAFIWNFADVIIMLVGSALKFRLKQVSMRIKSLHKMTTSNIQIWRSLRKDYLRIVALCQSTNKKLSLLILISFLVNLYFILKQIFRSLTKLRTAIERAYFYISFILLVLRISLVIIFGSGVHEEWKDICFFLQSVQSSSFNEEVERFIKNVATYELVLSGKNFFSIRRSLILQIAGTIVTYELVIIQFHADMFKNEE